MADDGMTAAAKRAKVTFLTGTDMAGVRDRYDEVLSSMSDAGRDAPSFGTMEEGVYYLSSCGLFDPQPRIGISSCTDAVRSGTAAKGIRRGFDAVIRANPDAEVVVMLGKKPGRTAAETELASIMSSIGAEVVTVNVPYAARRVQWLLDYADRHGSSLAESTAATVIECIGENDLSVAAELVSSLGNELNEMRRSEILSLVPVASESTYTRIRKAIVARDAVALRQCRRELPDGKSGDRMFATKARYAVQRLLLASGLGWERKDVLAHGKGNFGDSYARTLMSEAAGSGGQARYAAAYAGLCAHVTALTGFSNRPDPDMDAIMATLLA